MEMSRKVISRTCNRTLKIDIRNQTITSIEQGWLLAEKNDVKVTSLANIEDSMFGHNLMDVRINDQVVPIVGYKLNHKSILIDGNLAKVRNHLPKITRKFQK